MSTNNISESCRQVERCRCFTSFNYFLALNTLFFLLSLFILFVSKPLLAAVNPTAICFDNPNKYNNPTLHLWNSIPTGSVNNTNWPGHEMFIEGSFYCYDPGVPIDGINLIFSNDGNPQTLDLLMNSPNNCWQSGTWKSLADCALAVSSPLPNIAPTANAGEDIEVIEGITFTLSASASFDPDGNITNYNWSNQLTGISPLAVYNTPGSYTVTLTVTDNQGATSSDIIVVTVIPKNTQTVTATSICYDNTANYQTPTIYMWDSTPADTLDNFNWPGEAMTQVGEYVCYDPMVELTSMNVIFNNGIGNGQTNDLAMITPNACYKNNEWMSLASCGMLITSNVHAGGDRSVNVNTKIALTVAESADSLGNIDNASWQSTAWTGTLTGASVITPTLSTTGTFNVTVTLANGNQDSFNLTVVNVTQGMPERPKLSAPLNFPLTGNVSSGNYKYEFAFPALNDAFSSPVMVTNDGLNDLIYVVDKSGKVFVFPNNSNVTSVQVNTLIDISSEVRDYHEQGLLAIAFHPNFASNRFAYIYYIEGNSDTESDNGAFGDGVLERITLNDASNPTQVSARVEVLRIPQPGPDHKGSMMQFHPVTGEFYMSIGDGAYGDTAITPTQPDPRTNNSSQQTTNLRGSFIRLIMRETPNIKGLYYDIPSDNPFIDDANVRDEIWSYGHRNPWRFSFDSEAPYLLWQTEVGQAGFEEINIIEAGGNYGWPICEGLNHRGSDGGDPNNTRTCSNDLIAPVGGYAHDTGSVSIIGGFVYRGTAFPALNGRFIYGDYVSKKIWSAVQGDTNQLVSDAFAGNISSFGTDMSGEAIFVTSHGAEYGGLSIIYRMVDSDAQAAVIPNKLSKTGLFADLIHQYPVHGVIEYDVNSDGWFDGLIARHFVAIPNESVVEFNPDDIWNLPIGSVLVKHLSLPTQIESTEDSTTRSTPFETSVLFKQNAGNWASANYRWNAQGTDANLVTQAFNETVEQFYNGSLRNIIRQVRSGAECTSCHLGTGSKEPLAISTAQLNRDFNYQGVVANQINLFNQLALFGPPIASADSFTAYPDPQNTSANLDKRARAYLDTNCAHCHDGSLMDLNYDTPVNKMDIMNVKRSDVYRMLPFNHSASLLHIYQTDDANRMPKGSTLTNPLAAQLIADWIDGQSATQTGLIVALDEPIDETAIVPNSRVTLSTYAMYDNGFESIPTNPVTWSSSNTEILNPLGSEPIVTSTAGNAGNTTVWADYMGQIGSIDITVLGAPNQPTNFSATSTGSNSIILTWNDVADDEQSYILSRSINNAGPFSPIITLSQNSNEFFDNGLTSNTTYYYQLIASGTNTDSIAVTTNTTTKNADPIDQISIISTPLPNLIAGESQQLAAVAYTNGENEGITLAANWLTSDDSIVSVSSTGLMTAGNTAGTAIVTATYQTQTASVTVVNQGAGQYVYFNVPSNWDTPSAYIWSNENATLTTRSADWPGNELNTSANLFGDTWLRLTLPATWANSNGNINIIFSNNGVNQTADLTANIASPMWYDDTWLTAAPTSNGVETGSQVQVGNGTVTLNNSANLSGKLFATGTVVNINADAAATGLEFSGWEGSGVAYLVNPSQENTQLVVGDALSYTLLAVFNSVSDPYLTGRTFYNNQGCAGCHGSDGAQNIGGKSLLNAINRYDLNSLTAYIENNMPFGNAAACTGDCATSTASLILAEAYTAPTNICNSTDLDDLIPQNRSYRLLSTLEYNNSIRDLFALENNVDVTSGRIPADIPVNGFKTSANTLFTNDYAKGYVVAAETAAMMVDNIYSLTLNCNDISCFINDFGKRAFRRPLTPTELTDLTSVYNEHGNIGVLSAILSAPAMLYRSEVGESNGAGYFELTDYEIATLLSYTYWATTPSPELMAKADAGELSTPTQIAATLGNMLQDARAETAFERFITGWLDLDKDIKTSTLSDSLKADMKQETIEFVRRTVFGGGQYRELLTADYSFMTQQLAEHYGLQWPGGDQWQQVNYNDGTGESNEVDAGNSERRGILGHAGILTLQSASEKTHPVKRGLFVRRNLMCQDFPPPPIGAVLKPQDDPSLTVRERFETAHLQNDCQSCHQYIDGIGFGFENYNEIGVYTTTETTGDGQVKFIDSSGYIGSLFSAETFLSASEPVVPYQGIDELAELIADSAHGKSCYARQWYRYTRGQRETNEDTCTVQVLGQLFKDDPNATLLDLMIQFTQTKNYTLRK